jgi:hypothetical protein
MNGGQPNMRGQRSESPTINSVVRSSILCISIVVGISGLLSPSAREATPKSLNKCSLLSSAGGKYVLEHDVSSPGTCFSVQANNITLDLNGYTITYGTGVPKTAAFGILGIACWDTALSNGVANGNPCGGSFDGFTVVNGSIVQTTGMAPFSDAIHLGQGGGNHLDVHDVEFKVDGDSAIPIFTIFSGAGSMIYRNIIHSNVRTVRNRHQLQGMSVKFEGSRELPPGQSVHDNQIVGGAQGGIFLETPGATAYRNKIRQNGHYTNDFSIYLWGNNEQAYENEINVISGRGIQIAGGAINTGGAGKGGKHSVARENKINVIELKQNCDYSGGGNSCNVCQPGGAYGIQFDDNPQGSLSFKNEVLARADECDASALRVTDSELRQNESQDDSFIAVRVRSNSPGEAYAWDNSGPTAFTAENDIFVADTASYHVSWDGAQNEICVSCTFGQGNANPSPKYVTFSFHNGGNNVVRNVYFQDSKFMGGAKKDSTDMKPILSNGDWPGPSEYSIEWTVTLSVHDQLQRPVPGADVSFRDALNHLAYQGKTNQAGTISVALMEFRIYNTYSQVLQEFHTPYSVSIDKKGCSATPSTSSIEVKEKIFPQIGIFCGSN